MFMDRIDSVVQPGTVIPKPRAKADFTVKGWGRRRGEDALIYLIPNRHNPSRPYEKGITVTELRQAYDQLTKSGEFSRSWFNQNMAACATEGSCNFTTVGGILDLLGEATYYGSGVYRKTGR